MSTALGQLRLYCNVTRWSRAALLPRLAEVFFFIVLCGPTGREQRAGSHAGARPPDIVPCGRGSCAQARLLRSERAFACCDESCGQRPCSVSREKSVSSSPCRGCNDLLAVLRPCDLCVRRDQIAGSVRRMLCGDGGGRRREGAGAGRGAGMLVGCGCVERHARDEAGRRKHIHIPEAQASPRLMATPLTSLMGLRSKFGHCFPLMIKLVVSLLEELSLMTTSCLALFCEYKEPVMHHHSQASTKVSQSVPTRHRWLTD